MCMRVCVHHSAVMLVIVGVFACRARFCICGLKLFSMFIETYNVMKILWLCVILASVPSPSLPYLLLWAGFVCVFVCLSLLLTIWSALPLLSCR